MLNAIVWLNGSDGNFYDILGEPYRKKIRFKCAQTFESVMELLASPNEFQLIITILAPSNIEVLYQIKVCQDQHPYLSMIAIFDTTDISAIEQALGLILGAASSNEIYFHKNEKKLTLEPEDNYAVFEQSAYTGVAEKKPIEESNAHHCYLTPRQREVLSLIMQGKSNKQIARDLSLSEGTVKVHCMALFKEMCVTNRTQAALMADSLLRAV